MKFTSQEEYGLRCILQLARHQLSELPKDNVESSKAVPSSESSFPETSLTVAEIARLEGLTPQYAGKLISNHFVCT